MARVTLVSKPIDYPGTPDAATQAELATLFATLFPDAPGPGFDGDHDGMAIAAHNPALALQLAQASGLIVGKLRWSARRDLRELAIQTVNRRFGNDYSFDARIGHAEAAGIDRAKLNALPVWRDSDLFSDEERLVIEYAEAVVAGAVPDLLFARVKAAFGERGAVECTTVIAFFAFWAMFLNATRPGA